MGRHNELATTSLRGKLARGVCALLLAVMPLVTVPCVALVIHQGMRPRFENNQQPHLGAWLQRHGNLSPQEQERALQSEPGFSRLNPEAQQKLLDRLRQLNRMPPNQRERTVEHIEALEQLSPQMRQQVRASFQDFRSLPPDRQRMVRKAFRDLRAYPPEQRQAMMAAGQFQSEFTPQERNILGNILAVEPYHPVHGSGLDSGLENGR